MPPRRGPNGAVRGPASALTSFLAGLGVEPPNRLTTWSDVSALNNAPDTPIIDPGSFVTETNVEAGPSQAGEGSPEERPRKRARAASIDSDDLDAEQPLANLGKVAAQPLKAVGDFMQCGECAKRFTVTAYTKEHPKHTSTWLCVECCYALGIDPFEKPKKAKAKPAKKEERGKVTHYEVRKGASTLASVCIQIIGTYIEDVDQLGDIGSVNMDKVCRIISKSRKLTSATAPLFYSPERTDLAMYDCTRLDTEAYMALSALCPNLESLSLQLCGQISTDVITAWGKDLKALQSISLHGPFLVRKEGWISFFENSPRFDLECVETMVRCCPNLVELRLAEVGQMGDTMLQPLARLTRLQRLDLSSPGSGLSDNAVSELLASVDPISMNLSDAGLSDGVLPALAKSNNLREIYLRDLDFSDEAVTAFFSTKLGLQIIDMAQAHELRGGALRSLVAGSGATIERLSIHGWKDVESEALIELGRCKNLKELDMGWCRQVTDFTVKELLESCEQIEKIKVWGCNQLTDAVPRKRGVKVIGIETHAI